MTRTVKENADLFSIGSVVSVFQYDDSIRVCMSYTYCIVITDTMQLERSNFRGSMRLEENLRHTRNRTLSVDVHHNIRHQYRNKGKKEREQKKKKKKKEVKKFRIV